MLRLCSIVTVLLVSELFTEMNAKPQSERLPNEYSGSEATTDDKEKLLVVDSETWGNNSKTESGHRGQRRREELSTLELIEQIITFPDDLGLLSDPIPRKGFPPMCTKGSTFCENVISYPYHHLKEILKRNPVYKKLSGKDEAPLEIINRNGAGEDQERFFCSSFIRTIYPQIGKNKDNKWKYIVNMKEEDGIVQGLLVETCRSPNTPCEIVEELPLGYTTSCKQKYIYRRLLAWDGSGSIYPDNFKIPTACCCSYKRTSEILARFGTYVTPTTEKRVRS
ncbi:hypothetical protein JTB14_026455 [Gonioctena quinquepunctata]|nr:hypothetical protein JTB14_026455 [Gonioctena quinquepunctata]